MSKLQLFFLNLLVFISFKTNADFNPKILIAVQSTANPVGQAFALELMRSHAVSWENHKQIVDAGALPIFFAQFKESKKKEVRDLAFKNISTLAKFDESTRAIILEQGVITLCFKMIKLNKNNLIKQIEFLNFISFFSSDTSFSNHIFCDIQFLNLLISFLHKFDRRCKVKPLIIERAKASLKILVDISREDNAIRKKLRESKVHHLALKILATTIYERVRILAEELYNQISPTEPELIENLSEKSKCNIL